MSVKVTADGKTYTGVSSIAVGGKTLAVESEVSAPSGTKNITTNGTHDVSAYAQAVVNVPTDGESPVLQEKTVTITENGTTQILPDAGNDGMTAVSVTVNVEASVGEEKTDYYEFVAGFSGKTSNVIKLKHHGKVLSNGARASGYELYWADAQITVDDELQEIGESALYNVGAGGAFALLSNNNFANLTKLVQQAFRSSGITEANFPEVTTLTGGGGGQFAQCGKLTSIVLPKLTAWTNAMAYNNAPLTNVQIGSIGYGVTAVPSGGDFSNATALTETIYTTGDYVDTIVAAMRSANAAATIVIKASADTTYNGQSYAAGDTITTSTPEEA